MFFNIYILAEEVRDWTNLNSSLTNWVNAERFNTFVKVTRGNIHQVSDDVALRFLI